MPFAARCGALFFLKNSPWKLGVWCSYCSIIQWVVRFGGVERFFENFFWVWVFGTGFVI